MVRRVPTQNGVTFHDLYEEYPDFNIDIQREKKLLLEHDVIVWNHPFYWYNCPALLKQWIDVVLEVGWAYGPGGTALEDKTVVQVITTGGPQAAYQEGGYNRYTIQQFLAPFAQTARLCLMHYLPPYVVHSTHRLQPSEIRSQAEEYSMLLQFLQSEKLDIAAISQFTYLNDLIKVTKRS
jgi:glutathione-regulated potassium-efflux system ancillary protein KefG